MALFTVDARYLHPRFAAGYVTTDGDEAAIIETGTARSVDAFESGLQSLGSSWEAVRWIAITHVHLDHSAGVSALLSRSPNATVLCHARALRHLIDPSRLIAGARKVYGDERFDALYGTLEPIAEARIKTLEDGEAFALGTSTFRAHHTLGHAKHHLVLHDEKEDRIFTGDAFGLVYPDLQRTGRLAIASTSPTDFDGPEALRVVQKILAINPKIVCPTHFGEHRDVAEIGAQLTRWLEVSMSAIAAFQGGGPDVFRPTLEAHLEAEAQRIGLTLTAHDRELLSLDLELNAAGLRHAATSSQVVR